MTSLNAPEGNYKFVKKLNSLYSRGNEWTWTRCFSLKFEILRLFHLFLFIFLLIFSLAVNIVLKISSSSDLYLKFIEWLLQSLLRQPCYLNFRGQFSNLILSGKGIKIYCTLLSLHEASFLLHFHSCNPLYFKVTNISMLVNISNNACHFSLAGELMKMLTSVNNRKNFKTEKISFWTKEKNINKEFFIFSP